MNDKSDVQIVTKIYLGLTPEQRVLMTGLVLLNIGLNFIGSQPKPKHPNKTPYMKNNKTIAVERISER